MLSRNYVPKIYPICFSTFPNSIPINLFLELTLFLPPSFFVSTMPTPSLIDEDFSGTFISKADPTSFSGPEDHPIHKFFNGTISVREHILLKSPKVEAIVFVSNRKIFSLYLPKLTFDSVCYP